MTNMNIKTEATLKKIKKKKHKLIATGVHIIFFFPFNFHLIFFHDKLFLSPE